MGSGCFRDKNRGSNYSGFSGYSLFGWDSEEPRDLGTFGYTVSLYGYGGFTKQRTKRRYELRMGNEIEGYRGRTKTLYHVTSPVAAKLIIESKKMLRGSSGLFGGGIYFAETIEIANGKAHYHGATIKAKVVLGFSLICRTSRSELTYQLIHDQYGCNSTKGVGIVSNPEYVVYSWGQVFIKKVCIGEQVYYEYNGDIESRFYCLNLECIYFKTKHIGGCIIKCKDLQCLFYEDYHFGCCTIKCINNDCLFNRKYHKGQCLLGCRNFFCRDFGKYHYDRDCSKKCSNSNCKFRQKFHRGECLKGCMNSGCMFRRSYHNGRCSIKCQIINCRRRGDYHKGECFIKCTNTNCKGKGEYHKGECLIICSNFKCKGKGKYHKGECLIECKNRDCINYQNCHTDNCSIKCKNRNCNYYDTVHKGSCLIKSKVSNNYTSPSELGKSPVGSTDNQNFLLSKPPVGRTDYQNLLLSKPPVGRTDNQISELTIKNGINEESKQHRKSNSEINSIYPATKVINQDYLGSPARNNVKKSEEKFKNNSFELANSICNNSDCSSYKIDHKNSCTLKCKQRNCKYYQNFHLKTCKLLCINVDCKDFEKHHRGYCRGKYLNKSYDYGNNSYNKKNSGSKCSNLKCLCYYTNHEGSCLEKCNNKDCFQYKEHHLGVCKIICKNQSCLLYMKNHPGYCTLNS